MARTFDIQKNKEPLYWAVGLLIFGTWCLIDGWFPPESVLEKHPNYPENPWSLALDYEYYRFNRVTAVLLYIAAAAMGVVYRVVNKP